MDSSIIKLKEPTKSLIRKYAQGITTTELPFDCFFLVEGRQIGAHRIVVGSVSTFLKAVLSNEAVGCFKNPVITVTEEKYENVKKVLDLVYGRKVIIQYGEDSTLRATAQLFGFELDRSAFTMKKISLARNGNSFKKSKGDEFNTLECNKENIHPNYEASNLNDVKKLKISYRKVEHLMRSSELEPGSSEANGQIQLTDTILRSSTTNDVMYAISDDHSYISTGEITQPDNVIVVEQDIPHDISLPVVVNDLNINSDGTFVNTDIGKYTNLSISDLMQRFTSEELEAASALVLLKNGGYSKNDNVSDEDADSVILSGDSLYSSDWDDMDPTHSGYLSNSYLTEDDGKPIGFTHFAAKTCLNYSILVMTL